MQNFKCGVPGKVEDPNPIDSALAYTLIETLKDNILAFKTTKNQMIELKYLYTYGDFKIAFILPSSSASIKQAIKIVKKTITAKLVNKTFKLIVSRIKELKDHKEKVLNTIASKLMQEVIVDIYGKTDLKKNGKLAEFIEKIEKSYPKRLDVTD